MTEPDRDDWDPRDPSVLADQRRAYDEMRHSCPVAYSDFMGWSLFRHEDVVWVLEDPATYSSASRHAAIPNGIDPPAHGRFRAALAPHFADERMAALEPRSRQIAVELLESMLGPGQAELMEAFATPFTRRTLSAFLGWPEDMWEFLGGWTHGNQQAAFNRDPGVGRALAKLLSKHVKATLDAYRASGGNDDVTDALLATSVDGEPLDHDQIVSVIRNWSLARGRWQVASA